MALHRTLFVLASMVVAGCTGPSNPDGGTGSDVPGLDAPRADAAGLDAPRPDVPGLDAPEDPGSLPRVGHCGLRRGRYFPEGTWMYQPITSAPVRPNSAATTAWLEAAGGWGFGRFQIDTSFVILEDDGSAPRVARSASDPGDYFAPDCEDGVMVPIPAGGMLEGQMDYVCPERAMGTYTGDCHLLVADFGSRTLFESFSTSYEGGQLYSSCLISWDMNVDLWGAPPAPGSVLPDRATRNWGMGRGCTSTDAAGFPITPLLFTTEEVAAGRIDHAIRFALPNDRLQRAPDGSSEGPVFAWPASHAGGPSAIDPNAPIYGSRWRLRSDFDPAAAGLDPSNPTVGAVVRALQTYGMLLADGGNVALMAESDAGCANTWEALWGSDGSRVLAGIEPSDFDIIDTGGLDAGYDCVPNPAR